VRCVQEMCGMCPGTENLIKNTEYRFKDNIDLQTCKQWTTATAIMFLQRTEAET
jgi:hypothetical protein